MREPLEKLQSISNRASKAKALVRRYSKFQECFSELRKKLKEGEFEPKDISIDCANRLDYYERRYLGAVIFEAFDEILRTAYNKARSDEAKEAANAKLSETQFRSYVNWEAEHD